MSKKFFLASVFLIVIVSLSFAYAEDSDDWITSSHKVNIFDVKFTIPQDFEPVESECKRGTDYVDMVYSNGDDKIKIGVSEFDNVNSLNDIDWNKYYPNSFKLTVANKEGMSSYHFYPETYFGYVEDGKVIIIELPVTSGTHGTYEDLLKEILV